MHIIHTDLGSSNIEKDRLRNLGEFGWDKLRNELVGFTLPEWEKVNPDRSEGEESWKSYWNVTGFCTTKELEELSRVGFNPTIKRMKGLWYDHSPHELIRDTNLSSPTSIHITVPGGVALTNISKVDWMEDACTQELQERLNKGWRIIAVCPPNDTRRPTYILGHINSDDD